MYPESVSYLSLHCIASIAGWLSLISLETYVIRKILFFWLSKELGKYFYKLIYILPESMP